MSTQIAGYPLTRQQKNAWPVRNDPHARIVAVVACPTADREQVRSALMATVERHDVLRTAFRTVPGRRDAIQVPGATAEPFMIEASIAEGTDAETVAATAAKDLPFDVSAGRTLAIVTHTGEHPMLAVVASPMAADRASAELIAAEVVARLTGRADELPAAVSYVGYGSWQLRQWAEQDGAAQPERLVDAGLAECLEVSLPFQRADRGQSAATGVRHLTVPEIPDGSTDVPVADLLLAAWSVVLRSMTDGSRLVVGAESDGRTVNGLETAVGPYAGLVPLLVDVDDTASVADLARTLAEERARLSRRESRDIPGHFRFAFLDRGTHVERFTAAVTAGPRPALIYSRDEVPVALAESLAGQVEAVLAAVVDDPHRELATIAAGRADRLTAQRVGEPTAASYAHVRIVAQAGLTPDAVAVSDAAGRLTYAELVSRAGQWQQSLRARGVKEGAPVALVLNRGVEMAAVALAVMACGAIMVPIDPTVGRQRREQLIADSRPVLAIGDSTLLLDGSAGPDVLTPDDVPASDPDAALDEWRGEAAAPCYVMYTSGSTGTPKGVLITYGNVAAYLDALGSVLKIGVGDRYLHTASFGFSSAMRQLLLPLAVGAELHVVTRDQLMEPVELLRTMLDLGITVLDLVPSYWRQLHAAAEQDRSGVVGRLRGASLRLLLSASEPLSRAVADSILFLAPEGASVVNMFGQTETTGIVTVAPISRDALREDPVRLGVGLPGVRAYVADGDLYPVRVGVPGEIVVTGATVGAGYLDDPTATNEAFGVHPHTGERYYRTGDVGRLAPDGTLHLLGRRDNRVKVRGHRVGLAEIEAALTGHPAVQESVVLAVPTADDDIELRAFVLPLRDQRPTRIDLVSFLRSILPSYMMPTSFRLLTQLPRTVSGKVDKVALAALNDGNDRETTTPYAPPEGTVEASIANIWSQVLKIPRVGRNDNFFELGGQSLLGIEILARIESELGVRWPWSVVFEHPTIAELVAQVPPSAESAV